MTKLGLKRKDMEGYFGCAPCCDSDPKKRAEWDNQIVYPKLRLEGALAELFGIDDLSLGDRVKVELVMEVTELRANETLEDGKKRRDLCLGFSLIEASDLKDAGSGKPEDDEAVEDEGSALSAILPQRE
jgi:hypothetical protein